MASEAWRKAQEDLHRRLQAANAIEDDDEREEAQRKAFEIYKQEPK